MLAAVNWFETSSCHSYFYQDMTAELVTSKSKGNEDMPVGLPRLQQMSDILFTKGGLTFRS